MPRFPNISENASGISDRVYSQLAERARSKNDRVFPLHVGDTYREPLAEAQAENQRTKDHPRMHAYAPVQGEPELLEAFGDYIVDRHGIALAQDSLQVMSGATAGLSVVCQVLLNPGDEVLLPSPFWPLIRGIVTTKGATPVEVPFFTELDNPGFDPEKLLEERVTDKTVALYINTPNNPGGRVLTNSVVDAMLRVAERHDLWLLCDEAYEEIYFGEEPPQGAWTRGNTRERAIVCHTLSKSYGYAGARVGFTHGPAPVMKAIRGMQTFQTYCAPRPLQFGAIQALRHGRTWAAESRALYGEAGRKAASAFGVPDPQGGTFLFVDVARTLDNDDQDCTPFLERCADVGVLVTPGNACGRNYPRWVRVCFTSVPPADLDEALARLAPLLR